MPIITVSLQASKYARLSMRLSIEVPGLHAYSTIHKAKKMSDLRDVIRVIYLAAIDGLVVLIHLPLRIIPAPFLLIAVSIQYN